MKKLLIVLFSMALMVSLCGCGEKGPSPSDEVKTYLEELRIEISDEYSEGWEELFEETSESTRPAIEKLATLISDFTYEVVDEKINGKEATVSVKVETFDFGTAMEGALEALFDDILAIYMDENAKEPTDEEIDQMMASYLMAGLDKCESDGRTYSTTIDIKLEKDGKNWKVIDDEAYGDAFVGSLDALDDLDLGE